MNSKSDSRDLSPVQDRLTDALLAEHARLGEEPDNELVANILLNTVDAPVEISRHLKPSRPAFGLADWAKVAAAVVAILAIGTVFLMTSNSGPDQAGSNPRGGERAEQVFHLVIQTESRPSDEKKAGSSPFLVSTKPGSKKVLPVDFHDSTSGRFPDFDMELAELSPPGHQFGQSIDELPQINSVRSTFSLASNASTDTEGKIIYSGNVILKHQDFVIHADSLVMERSTGSPMLKALNARINHGSGDCIAEASTVVFDPAREELVANGVNRLLRHGVEETLDGGTATVVFDSGNVIVEKAYGHPR